MEEATYIFNSSQVTIFMRIRKNVTELLNFNDQIFRNCREADILGITLDRNLNFRSHIKKFAQK